MKFLKIIGHVDNSSFVSFKFDNHDANDVCCGDQIWSDGHCIEIADYTDEYNLNDLINLVDNKRAFRGALIRMGFDV